MSFDRYAYYVRPGEVHEVKPYIKYSEPRRSHIKLVKGVYLRNPHERVLCPTLQNGDRCKRGTRRKRGKRAYKRLFRPKLLLKHRSNPDLQLWQCEGCRNFLLRVEISFVKD